MHANTPLKKFGKWETAAEAATCVNRCRAGPIAIRKAHTLVETRIVLLGKDCVLLLQLRA